MTLLFIEGFDDGLTSLPGKWTSTVNPSITTGRNGSGWTSSSSTGTLTKVVAASDEHATFVVGYAFKPLATSGSSTASYVRLASDSAGTAHLSWRVTNLTIEVFRGTTSTGTLLGTSAAVLTLNAWAYIEVKATLHDSTGSVEVRVNGATVLTLTNVDTKNAGTKTVFDSVVVGEFTNANAIIDDIYLLNGAGSVNNNFLGDVAVETVYPSGNGSTNSFVGSDGNSTDNYLLVDEAGTPSTADYAESSTLNAVDLYAMANLTRTAGSIKGVMVTNYIAKSDAGTRNGRNKLKSGATTANGADTPLSTTYTAQSSMFETNPDTAGTWTIAEVNAVEAGAEVSL